MTDIIIDPEDPTQAFIGSSTDPVFGIATGDATLGNIHTADKCVGRTCIIHSPTQHHMRGWLLHWRDDRGIFERLCPHGIGHPDPDQEPYWEETGQQYQSIHGCDRCCATPPSDNTTHHLVPRADGMRCAYCKALASDLGPEPTQQICPEAP